MDNESVTPSSVSPGIETSSDNFISIKNSKHSMEPEIASKTILSQNNQGEQQQEDYRKANVNFGGRQDASAKTSKRKLVFENSTNNKSNAKFGRSAKKRKQNSTNFCTLVSDPSTNKCTKGEKCENKHGDLCDFCLRFVLPKDDPFFCKMHIISCKSIVQKKYISQLVQKSKNKACGICLEYVVDEAAPKRRVGILQNCMHIFCLECLRNWRTSKEYKKNIKFSCPECRVSSDFVYPSCYCLESTEEKQKFIADYKNKLMRKKCRYFERGAGECWNGNKCFYRHERPNGELVNVGSRKVKFDYTVTDESSTDIDESSTNIDESSTASDSDSSAFS